MIPQGTILEQRPEVSTTVWLQFHTLILEIFWTHTTLNNSRVSLKNLILWFQVDLRGMSLSKSKWNNFDSPNSGNSGSLVILLWFYYMSDKKLIRTRNVIAKQWAKSYSSTTFEWEMIFKFDFGFKLELRRIEGSPPWLQREYNFEIIFESFDLEN